jgi:hypothetical protein
MRRENPRPALPSCRRRPPQPARATPPEPSPAAADRQIPIATGTTAYIRPAVSSLEACPTPAVRARRSHRVTADVRQPFTTTDRTPSAAPIYVRYWGLSRHPMSAFRDRCNFSPVMSGFGGKADVRGTVPKNPLLAKRRHRYFTTWAHERTVEVQRMALANAEWMQAARKRQLSTRSWRGRREK